MILPIIFKGKSYDVLYDEEDHPLISNYHWNVCKSGKHDLYYVRANTVINGKKTSIAMHRLILGFPKYPEFQVDHINHNGLDNRRVNIRICTASENIRNRRSFGKVQYLGVHLRKRDSGYVSYGAGIRPENTDQKIDLGVFTSAEKAAQVYDIAALYYHKEFANLNFKENVEFYESLITENQDIISNSPKLIRHLIDPKYKFVNTIRNSICEKLKDLELTTEEIASVYGVSKQVVKYAIYPLVKKGLLHCNIRWLKSARAFAFSLPHNNNITRIPQENRLFLIGDVVEITKHKQKSLVGSVGVVTGYCGKEVVVTTFFMGVRFDLVKFKQTIKKTDKSYSTEEIKTGEIEFILHQNHTLKRIIFSAEDVGLLKKHTWSISSSGQIVTSTKVKGKWVSRLMSKMILGLSADNTEVTHLNGDKLDVRRSNLVPTSISPKVN